MFVTYLEVLFSNPAKYVCSTGMRVRGRCTWCDSCGFTWVGVHSPPPGRTPVQSKTAFFQRCLGLFVVRLWRGCGDAPTEHAAPAHLPRHSHLHAVQVMCTLAGGLARLTHLEHLDVNLTPWELKTGPCLAHSILQSMTGLTCLSICQTIYASPAASLLLCLMQLKSCLLYTSDAADE